MKFIKLTSAWDRNPRSVYVAVDKIEAIITPDYTSAAYTELGHRATVDVVSHNNGGFKVKETPEKILKMIEDPT